MIFISHQIIISHCVWVVSKYFSKTQEFIFIDFFVDLWWFQAQGMTSYYFLRLLYPYFILIFFTILFFAIFYVNFRVASRVIGFEDKPDGYKEKKWLKAIPQNSPFLIILWQFKPACRQFFQLRSNFFAGTGMEFETTTVIAKSLSFFTEYIHINR